MTQTLSQLEHSEALIERHIGYSAEQQQALLATVGARTLSALIQQILPADIQLPDPPPVGNAATEHQALAELKAIASQNQRHKSYIGMGYSAVLTTPLIQRNMLENPGWYTAYISLSAGSVVGPSGGAAELPDSDARSDLLGSGLRLACWMKRPLPLKRWRWLNAPAS